MIKTYVVPLIFILSAACVSPTIAADDIQTVEYVDLDRYLGKWYEIARLDQKFQKGCVNSTAEYSMREDGDIRVINRCELAGKSKMKEAVGRAWVTDKSSNSKLRVQFFLSGLKLSFLSGKYWILDLDASYRYVMVGDPSRKYFWLLSRAPDMDAGLLQELMEKAKVLGFDTAALIINANR